MTTSNAPLQASGPGGSIYDLGYQGYTGPRLGRQHALQALFFHTIRACYGIGRGGRAKIVPFGLAALPLLIAVIGVGIVALAKQAGELGSIVEFADRLRRVLRPHLDVRHPVLRGAGSGAARARPALQRPSLYFSRALARIDYALAKIGGMIASLLVLIVLPYACCSSVVCSSPTAWSTGSPRSCRTSRRSSPRPC